MSDKSQPPNDCNASASTSIMAPPSVTTELDQPPPQVPFVTTSDVLNQLNKNLSEMSLPSDKGKARFELQKRLPDGSTIPASETDKAASDFQTKLQQSAAFVAQLKPSDKRIWAEDQRHVGNAYFQRGDYMSAMDIYLTCLVVQEDSPVFVKEILVPVLNNLAQCTLQLGMYKKTLQFCKIALDEIDKHLSTTTADTLDGSSASVVDPIAWCKIFFKKAKAERLTGAYGMARDDLLHAMASLSKIKQDDKTQPLEAAIQKELRYLDQAEAEARKNRQRQKKAMENMWSSNKPAGSKADADDSVPSTPSEPRTFSKLRARKVTPHSDIDNEPPPAPSYSQYYWTVVARVAETLLVWLGDEDTKERLLKKED